LITVTTTTGSEQITASTFGFQQGTLILFDANGNNVAAFASGIWQSVVVTAA
jgi:hypothetical protein